jgi:hypothetical protein
MDAHEEMAIRLQLGIGYATKSEYDDNNYFDVEYICQIMGKQVDWGSWHTSDLFPSLVEEIFEKCIPSNSLKFMNDAKDEYIFNKIEELKNDEDYKYYPELIDVAIDCLKKGMDLKKVAIVIEGTNVY